MPGFALWATPGQFLFELRSNKNWWAARDSTSARNGHRDQCRWADGRRRHLVTGRFRRDAASKGREQPRTTGL